MAKKKFTARKVNEQLIMGYVSGLEEYQKIDDRVHYIIESFTDADRYVWVDSEDDKIEITYDIHSPPIVIIDKTGHPVNLCNTFPARWLFEDGFQKEIRDGLKLAKSTKFNQLTKDPAGLLKSLSNSGCGKVTIQSK